MGKIIQFQDLRSRLRNFTDNLSKDEVRAFRELGVSISPRWLAVLEVVSSSDRDMSVSNIARRLKRTHPEIVQIVNKLKSKNLVQRVIHPDDKRKTIISLTREGREFLEKIEPIIKATRKATNEWVDTLVPDLIRYVETLEDSLVSKSYYQRIIDAKIEIDLEEMKVDPVPFSSTNVKEFKNFYNQWKEKFYPLKKVEEVINDVNSQLGVEIFFIKNQIKRIGGAMVIRHSYNVSQLVFIWIEPIFRNKDAGSMLLKKIIKKYRQDQCKQMFIHTSKFLVGANHLFETLRFKYSDELQNTYPVGDNFSHTMILEL
jgi:DNA-binding MarR family transcriptional regulator